VGQNENQVRGKSGAGGSWFTISSLVYKIDQTCP